MRRFLKPYTLERLINALSKFLASTGVLDGHARDRVTPEMLTSRSFLR